MRKVLTILALTVAGTLLSADESSAQGRRRGYYPTYTYPVYTPSYTYGTTTGVQLATPITTVSGNTVVYGNQPVYTSGYSPTYNSGYYNSGYYPTYNTGYYNSGYNSGYYPTYNAGYYGSQYSSPALQLNSIIRSRIR